MYSYNYILILKKIMYKINNYKNKFFPLNENIFQS